MVDWPSTMPPPSWGDVSVDSPQGGVIRTQMDTGPSKLRRRSTASSTPMSLVFKPVSNVVYADFVSFYDTNLQSGTLPFNMADPITEIVSVFRFVDGYSISPIGLDAFEINVNLEKMP